MSRGKIIGGVVALLIIGAIADGTNDKEQEPPKTESAATEPVEAAPIDAAPAEAAEPTATATPATSIAAKPGTALAVVRTLTVKGRAPMSGYGREQFGAAWTDTDRNGCDTRNDILRRDLSGEVIRAGTHGCVVLSGNVSDPYTRKAIHFVRGGANEVDIDHVVALGDAWQKGAQGWVFRKRLALANDPLNLLAVDYSANRQKGDGDAATWLPSNRSYRCAYVARQVGVKKKYGLWVTAAEKAAMVRVLSGCPNQVAPSGGNPVIASVAGTPPRIAPRPAPKPAPEAAPKRVAPRPAPRRVAPRPAPKPAVRTVHPGAFCAPVGATGRTSTGKLMRCTYKAGDSRARWRAA